jgi:hypothetical protein
MATMSTLPEEEKAPRMYISALRLVSWREILRA